MRFLQIASPARPGRVEILFLFEVLAILISIAAWRFRTRLPLAVGPPSEDSVRRVRCNRLTYMSEPARDLPVSPAVEHAVELARHGVITHLTVHGERVAAIVPESVLDALRAAEDAEDAAQADAAMREPGNSVPLEELEAEFGL
jgi:hypothetical protein